ncbi:MAG: hypothetical protein HY831_00325 [Candidatus Aenigmarchaeota archaeon]|nr:hypothetical protein [Candidatus Aenigmarchaeota archaeon]
MGFSDYFNSMYVWAIGTLIIIAALASYTLNTIPLNLILAVFLCCVIDILIKKIVLKKDLSFPKSAFITGLIIGSVGLLNFDILYVVIACLIAIGSKHVIRLKGRHIFNPAALGLLVSLVLLSTGETWWATTGFLLFGLTIPLTVFLIFANYKADKLKIAIPAILLFGIVYFIEGYLKLTFTLNGILGALAVIPFFFIFIMLSEPKTSPYFAKEQLLFALGVVSLGLLLEYMKIFHPMFLALLAGNLVYAIYRSRPNAGA